MSISTDKISTDKILEVTILQARHLPKVDTFGSCDPFVTVDFGGTKATSTVKKNIYSPDWNEVFFFPCQHISALLLEMYDWNRTSKSVQIGMHIMTAQQMAQIISEAYGWEERYTVPLKSGERAVIGNDKEQATVTIKLRILANSSHRGLSMQTASGSGASLPLGSTPLVLPRRRIGIYVRFAEMPSSATTYVKFSVGDTIIKSHQVTGAQPSFDFHCALEVTDEESSVLVQLKKPGAIKASTVGRVQLPIPSAVSYFQLPHTDSTLAPTPQRIQLLDGEGRALPGMFVTLQYVTVFAPEAPKALSAVAATWNVGNGRPDVKLQPWLRPRDDSDLPDLIFIGTQESTFESANCEAEFYTIVKQNIGDFKDTYCLVSSYSLGQIRGMVWARLWIRAGIGSVEVSREATGVGHVLANKGGLAIAIDVWDTSIVFVNSHLAAHQDQVQRRNEDFGEIVMGLNPGLPKFADIITGHDHCIWVGDLNYRLDFSNHFGANANSKAANTEVYDKVMELCEQGQYKELLDNDQLKLAIKSEQAFVGFVEGHICHPPTFKVKRQSGIEYSRERVPAYCDRVLWRSATGCDGQISSEWCAPEVTSSDHKPVAATLTLGCRQPRPAWWPRKEQLSLREKQRKEHAHIWAGLGACAVPVTWRIDFLSLQGEGLRAADTGGTSDPYITFSGPACIFDVTTEPVCKTLDPIWPVGRLPAMFLAADNDCDLEGDYIRMCVMDHDQISADDLLGNAVLPLKHLLFLEGVNPFQGQWAPNTMTAVATFDVPVWYAGLRSGRLMGSVKVSPSDTFDMARLWDAKSSP